MADFNFFLNRQGIQGRKGDKGDAGFTPTISVSEQTLNSYKLKITNEYNEFETPNLIGNLGVADNGGTYLRYDPTTGTVSTGEIDGATTEVVGGVRKSTDADLTNLSADTAVTPANVADMLPLLLEAGTDNVTITQDEATSKTKISVEGGGSGDVTAAGNNRFTGNNTFTGEVNIAGGALTVDGLANLNQATAQYLNAVSITSSGEVNAVSIKANGLRSDDIQTTENKKYLTELDVDNQTIQVVDGKLHANLDELGNEVNSLTGEVTSLTGDVTDLTGRITVNEADISAMKTGKQNKLTAGSNIILTNLTDGTVRIDATGGGGTGDIPIATTTTAGKVKPDGKTITITDDGTISAVGGGGSTTDSYTKSETDALLSEKNDKIFDISKFKVVGNPNITDDGVVSGFNVSDYVTKRLTFTPNSSLKYTLKFTTSSNIDTNQYIVRFYNNLTGQYETNACGIYQGNIRVIFKDGVMQTYPCNANTTYYVEMNFTTAKSEAKIYSEKKELLNTLTYTTSPILMKGNNSLLTIGILTNDGITISNPFTGSIDLKHFSITVDGKEVFNGLMNSTKPIYDAIKANNTELSEFKTETSNDFSAVNSALNEKANLSDVALKQNLLVSGTNIKTINGETILGEGDITVGGSTPANMVTTDTSQTITGVKTFQTLKIKELNTAGSTEIFANHGLLVRNNSEDSTTFQNTSYLEINHGQYTNEAVMRFGQYDTSSSAQKISSLANGSGSYGNLILEANSGTSDKSSLKLTSNSLTFTASDGTVTNLLTGGGGSAPTNMVTTDTAQDINANKTFYGEIRVGADNNYATLAKFSKEALVSGDSTLSEHIDLGEADFVVQGNLGKKVYETDKYVYKKYINVDDLSDNQIAMDNSISSQVAHMVMPSDKYIDLTLGASGATYTAPANGWYYFSGKSNNANQYLDMQNITSGLQTAFNLSASGQTGKSFLPAKKGDIIKMYYNFGDKKVFRFVYSIGSQPTL